MSTRPDDPVTYAVAEHRLDEWRQNLHGAMEQLQDITRHQGRGDTDIMSLADLVLMGLIGDAESLIEDVTEDIRSFVKFYPHERP